MEAIAVICPVKLHYRLEGYFRGKDEYNIDNWKKKFNDDQFDVDWEVIDSDTGTAFLVIKTVSDNYKEITETLVSKLEEAIEFVQNVNDVPIRIIYRHSGMRYDATFYDGECSSYGEYQQM